LSRRARAAALPVIGMLAIAVRAGAFDSPRDAFAYIYKVATHPRCVNCHGTGEGAASRPLVGDAMEPHPMNVTISHNPPQSLGIECGTCHGDRNLPERGTPPGASNTRMSLAWQMPRDDAMRVWPILTARALSEGQKQAALCRTWNRFLTTRGQAEFRHHIADDPLIEWALTPSPARAAAGEPRRLGEAVDTWIRWLGGGGSCDDLAR
jgi:mono/diheme cytochrome c family protein